MKTLPWMQQAYAYAPPDARQADLRLDRNESVPPPRRCLEALVEIGPEILSRYPDRSRLEQLLAKEYGCGRDQILVTAGGDEAIERACKAVLAPGRELVMPVPTFEMISRYAALTGADVRKVDWSSGPYPVDAVLEACSERTALVTIVSPNNPTGAVASAADLRRLAAALPNALLLVDLAYAEFADEDLTATVLELDNAVGVRTLSKAWGLAGLRVGAAIGARRWIDLLQRSAAPYSVSGPSLALAELVLNNERESRREVIALIQTQRALLEDCLRSLGASPLPSQANFVFAQFADAPWTADALASLGIAVRRFPALPTSLRITCPGEEPAFARLVESLGTVLAPEAILFDLDGVLADVSRSYRKTIIETAATFEVEITPADISALKREGGFNNDWVVSRELLRRGGREVELEEVKQRFEEIYQGTAKRPGLYETESLTVGSEWIRRLSQRFALGVVTGRPRQDALRFLQDHGIADAFRTVISMEDAPLKPDPQPVKLALEQLGVKRAWMVGDTVDDVVSARGAGVLPLSVIAPGELPESRAALLEAGAARVLAGVTDIEEVLP